MCVCGMFNLLILVIVVFEDEKPLAEKATLTVETAIGQELMDDIAGVENAG